MSDPLEEQALKLLDEAKTDRQLHEPWQRDVYRYCMPWRRRPGTTTQVNDQDELFDATGIGALSDFASDMQKTFTPTDEDWLSAEPSKTLGAADMAMIAKPLADYQAAVFAEIRRSNFYEASLEAYPDLGLGTVAACIQDLGNLLDPIHCQAVPITDLLIVRGVHGGCDFRAREIPAMKLRDIPPTYPRAAFDEARINANPGSTVCVHECWWRLWDVPKTERWQYVLLIDNKIADAAVFQGPGSCGLIVARWRTDSTTAWGIGPLYVVLTTIKTLDVLKELSLKQLSFAVDPARTYDNDGVINVEGGIAPGDWIPRQPGSKIDDLGSDADFDTSFFVQDKMVQEVRQALYQDKPVQSGDTPPTASQWMEESARVAQRMGAPFGRMTTEWQVAIFQRFAWLLENRGVVPQNIRLSSGKVRLRAQSPLVRAANQHKVVLASNLLATGNQAFGPEQMQVLVDSQKTLGNFKDALGDKLVEVRDAATIQQLMTQAASAATPPPPASAVQPPPPQAQNT